MKFNVVTIFPKLISHYAGETILGRAENNKLISVKAINLRDFTTDKHKSVDDTPYGGGAGMVMKPGPIFKALTSLRALTTDYRRQTNSLDKMQSLLKMVMGKKVSKKTVLLSPRGKQFDQRMAEKFSKLDELTFVCGRYEGIDQRVVDNMVDEEVSIGPYVLAGGELGALVIIEAVSRLIPGVLGNAESLSEESYGTWNVNHGTSVEYPQYTKPDDFKGWKVPRVLLSGDHKKIKDWRREQAMKYEK